MTAADAHGVRRLRLFESRDQPSVERVRRRSRYHDGSEVGMCWVDKVVGLPFNDRARHFENEGTTLEYPSVADRLSIGRRRMAAPVPWQRGVRERLNGRLVNLCRDQGIRGEYAALLKTNEYFQGGERDGFRGIGHTNAYAAPATAVEASALSIERTVRVASLGNTPNRNHRRL